MKRMEDNQERLKALNIPILSRTLVESYSATSKQSSVWLNIPDRHSFESSYDIEDNGATWLKGYLDIFMQF